MFAFDDMSLGEAILYFLPLVLFLNGFVLYFLFS